MPHEASVPSSQGIGEVLTDDEIGCVLRKIKEDGNVELISSEVSRAAEGYTGHLGDHLTAVLCVKVDDVIQNINLFIKRIPVDNKPKADILINYNFFKRELLAYQLMDEFDDAGGPNPWHVKALVCTDRTVVLPELTPLGYAPQTPPRPLSAPLARLAAAAAARMHAAFAVYNYRRVLASDTPYDFYREHEHILEEPNFKDGPWLRTAAKLIADFVQAFSTKYLTIQDLRSKMVKTVVEGCNTLIVAEGTLNVLLHTDLWNNNMLFKYEKGEPTNVILVDFQCVRYGPPAFDLMVFLYMSTDRKFRGEHEDEIIEYYYEVFSECIDAATREQLASWGYGLQALRQWCERARMFGMTAAAGICPLALLSPRAVLRHFSDPSQYDSLWLEHRSRPILEHAAENDAYREWLLELFEEYTERFVLNQP